MFFKFVPYFSACSSPRNHRAALQIVSLRSLRCSLVVIPDEIFNCPSQSDLVPGFAFQGLFTQLTFCYFSHVPGIGESVEALKHLHKKNMDGVGGPVRKLGIQAYFVGYI